MRYCLCLVAVALLAASPAGAVPDTTTASPMPAAQQSATSAEASPDSPSKPPTLRERLRNLFRPRPSTSQPSAWPAAAAKQPAAPVLRPVPMPSTPAATGPGAKIALSDKDLEKVGHEKDYSWITGKVFQVGRGQWVIRYAGPYEVDPYGGTLILSPAPEPAKFRNGDLVCVLGKVIGNGAKPSAGAVYQVSSINLIEHPVP